MNALIVTGILIIWLFINTRQYLVNRYIILHTPMNIFMFMMVLIFILPLSVRGEINSIYADVFVVGFLSALFGFFIAIVLFGKKKHVLSTIDNVNFELPSQSCNYLFFFGVLGYLTFFAWKGIPILSNNLDVARVESTAGAGVLLFPSSIMLTLAIWIRYLYFLNGKDTKKNISVYVTLTLIIMFSTGWRGHLIHLIIGLLLIYSIFKGIKIKQIVFVLFLALIMGLLAIFRSVLSQKNLYDNQILALELTGLEYIYYSFFYVYLRLSEHYFNFVEVINGFQYHPFLMGGGLVMDIPGGEKSLDYYIRSNFKVNDWEGGAGMPPTAFGSMYAEYGIIGVSFLSVFWSFIMGVIYKALSFNSALGICLYVSTLVWFFKSILGQIGLSFMIYGTVYFIGIILVFSGYKFFAKIDRYKK